MNTQIGKILIADDHQLVIDGIQSLLHGEPGFSIIGEALNGILALEFLQTHPVDLLIADINMPELGGIDLTIQAKQQFPDLKIMILSMYDDQSIVSEIIRAGAEGYILKNTGKQELINAIHNILDGSTHFSREILAQVMSRIHQHEEQVAITEELTQREQEILNLIVQEKTSAEISQELFISHRTVDTHRKNMMEKTGSKSVVGLILYAFRHKLISPDLLI